MKRLSRIAVLLVTYSYLVGAVTVAAEPAPKTEPTEPVKEVSDLALPEPKVEPEPETKDDPLPGGAESLLTGDEDPLQLLDDALTSMDEAADELANDTATERAVEHQKHAVDQLKKLLEAAQKQQSSQQQQNSSQSSQRNSSNRDQQSRDRQNGPQSSDSQGANGKRRQDDQNSKESSEGVEGATQSTDGPLGAGAKTNAVWGHLPPREQEALFRSLSDKFLPEYEAMIRKYYEALAEEK